MKPTIYCKLSAITITFLFGFCPLAGLQAARPEDPIAAEGPRRFDVEADAGDSPELLALIARYRKDAERYVFLSGGASKMAEEKRLRLVGLFQAFRTLAGNGMRFAVGDGGTKAGIMEAAGAARRDAGGSFDVLGISPAPEIAPGKTPVDPHHSDVIGITNQAWIEEQTRNGWDPTKGYWGSETSSMYQIFDRISAGRPSVTLVANGGGITLDEIAASVKQGRPMIVVQGSGRVADAIVEILFGEEADPFADEKIQAEFDALKVKVAKANLPRGLFTVFRLESGPDALAELLTAMLADDPPAAAITAEVRDQVRRVAFDHLVKYQEGYERYSGEGMSFRIGEIKRQPFGETATVDVVYQRDRDQKQYQGQLIVDIPSGRVVHSWNR